MSSREITLWLDERWYQALSRQLEVEKLEDKLNEYLDDLINLLPSQVYDNIIMWLSLLNSQSKVLIMGYTGE